MRLTVSVIQQLLNQNEGFGDETHYSAKNITDTRAYLITGGQLRIRSTGKTSWADSRFDDQWIADTDEARRFLRDRLSRLNTDGLD